MNIEELYHFLFETMPGIGILVGGGLVISIIVCFILERKTRKQFKNHEKTEDDWSLFDDDEDESEYLRPGRAKTLSLTSARLRPPHPKTSRPRQRAVLYWAALKTAGSSASQATDHCEREPPHAGHQVRTRAPRRGRRNDEEPPRLLLAGAVHRP